MVLYPGTYLDEGFLVHVSPDAELVDTQDLDLDQIMSHLRRAPTATGSRWSGSSPATRRSTPRCPSRPVGSTQAGVPWDVTPGVPAYAAAAALVGRELTVPLVAQSVVLTRAQARSTAMPEAEALGALRGDRRHARAAPRDHPDPRADGRAGDDYGADCPVVVVHRASQPGQIVLRGTVADIAEQVELEGLARPRHPGRPAPSTARRRRRPGVASLYDCPSARPLRSADVARGPHPAGGRTTGRGRAHDQQALHVDRRRRRGRPAWSP